MTALVDDDKALYVLLGCVRVCRAERRCGGVELGLNTTGLTRASSKRLMSCFAVLLHWCTAR